jgi:hypothetical protein
MRERQRNGRNGHSEDDGAIYGLSQEQGYALLDRLTQKHLEMSAGDFILAWRAGQFKDEREHPEAVRLAMMIPLAV